MTQPGEVRIAPCACCRSPTRPASSDFARGLAALGVELVSTGGTAAALQEAGLEVRPIEDFTGFPEIMDGRVKTLHPRLYAGLLALRDDPSHMEAAERAGRRVRRPRVREPLPVRGRRRRGAASTEHEVIENIDIGGPTMIRAAAKNFGFSAVVVKPESYDAILQELDESDGRLSLSTRESLAVEAFTYTARYDTAISRWFVEKHDDFPPIMLNAYEKVTDLAYGENPHQRAAYYRQVGARMDVLSMVRQLGGKELSFNNVLDLNAGRLLVGEFELPACAIIKHNNPCGCAVGGYGARRLPARVRVRPAVGVRRRDLPQPAGRRARSPRRCSSQFVEVVFAPRLHRRGARDPRAASRTCASSRTTSGGASTSPSATSSA